MICLIYKQVVEYERPASLETYRLAHKASKDELDKFLNTYKEYKDLVTEAKRSGNQRGERMLYRLPFSAFWKKVEK